MIWMDRRHTDPHEGDRDFGDRKPGDMYMTTMQSCRAWWLIGRFCTFRPKGRGFKSRSSIHDSFIRTHPEK